MDFGATLVSFTATLRWMLRISLQASARAKASLSGSEGAGENSEERNVR